MTQSTTQLTLAADASAPLTADAVLSQVRLIQDVMGKVMREGEHFGTVPGCGNKKALFKSGAEKLCLTFRMVPQFDIDREDLPNGHRTYQVRCRLTSASGHLLGEGVGAASTLESRYRYRKAELTCPECGKPAIIKGKEQFGGGWLCFAKKGGCGHKWSDDDNPFAGHTADKTEHPDPADYYNTVLKIAKKRAQVDAILTATAASDMFTQDVDEDAEPPQHPADPRSEAEGAPIQQPSTKKAVANPSGIPKLNVPQPQMAGGLVTEILPQVEKKPGAVFVGKLKLNTYDHALLKKAASFMDVQAPVICEYTPNKNPKYGLDLISIEEDKTANDGQARQS